MRRASFRSVPPVSSWPLDPCGISITAGQTSCAHSSAPVDRGMPRARGLQSVLRAASRARNVISADRGDEPATEEGGAAVPIEFDGWAVVR